MPAPSRSAAPAISRLANSTASKSFGALDTCRANIEDWPRRSHGRCRERKRPPIKAASRYRRAGVPSSPKTPPTVAASQIPETVRYDYSSRPVSVGDFDLKQVARSPTEIFSLNGNGRSTGRPRNAAAYCASVRSPPAKVVHGCDALSGRLSSLSSRYAVPPIAYTMWGRPRVRQS